MSVEDEIRLLMPQAHYAPEYVLPGPASPEAIEALEREVGLCLSEPHKRWLQICDGLLIGTPVFGVNELRSQFEDWRAFYDPLLVPVANDGCGNYYVTRVGAEPDPVYFLDAIRAPELQFCAASNVLHLVDYLLMREVTGAQLSPSTVLARDPALATLGATLMWDDEG